MQAKSRPETKKFVIGWSEIGRHRGKILEISVLSVLCVESVRTLSQVHFSKNVLLNLIGTCVWVEVRTQFNYIVVPTGGCCLSSMI